MSDSSVIRGVFAAALTPMTTDLAPDLSAMITHFKWLLERGCDGIGVLGTTGEANSFSVEERLEIIYAVGNSDLPSSKLMIGTGTCAEPDTLRLSQAALAAGIKTVLMLPPFYYKGITDEGLANAFARIIEGIGDDDLKVVLYHFPKMTGVPITAGAIELLLKDYPSVVVGLKDSSGDLDNMMSLMTTFPEFGVYAGTERYLLPILQAGGPGCISASANVTSAMAQDVYQAFRTEKSNAKALQEQLTAVRQVFDGLPLIGALKEAMANLTGRTGWRALRPPLTLLDAVQSEQLRESLDQTGFSVKAAA